MIAIVSSAVRDGVLPEVFATTLNAWWTSLWAMVLISRAFPQLDKRDIRSIIVSISE